MLHFFMYFAARLMFICDYAPLKLGKFVYTIESKCTDIINTQSPPIRGTIWKQGIKVDEALQACLQKIL